jgi:DNA primase
MSDIVNDIKTRLSIEELVGQYVTLHKAGRNFKGLCPFHQEKTPSFVVSPEKQIAHCFGCHKGGDIISFIEEVENVDFKEAVKILAEKAGLSLSDYTLSDSKYKKSEKEEMFDAHKETMKFYEKELWESTKGKKVLEYLKDRGLTEESIKFFNIGYSPDSFDKTHLHLVKKGFSRKTLSVSGLVSSKDIKSNKVFDRFRGRLMFPIMDKLGRIVGFGGRALKKGDDAKYINSPDTPIYNKSETVYGFYYGKKDIREKKEAIFVEGYFDVILSYQAGIKNVVATSGTAMTKGHIALLKRFADNMILCFDNDEAGQNALKRAFELIQPHDVNVKVIRLEEGKDPADLVQQDPDTWIETASNPVRFFDHLLNLLGTEHDISNIEGQKSFMNSILPFLILIKSPVEKDYWIRELAEKLRIKERQIYDEITLFNSKNTRIVEDDKKEPSSIAFSKKIKASDLLLGLFEVYEELFNTFKDIPQDIFNEEQKAIYTYLQNKYNKHRAGELEDDFLANLKGKLDILSLFVEEKYENFSEEAREKECNKLIEKALKEWKQAKQKEILYKLRTLEREGRKGDTKSLLEELKQLTHIAHGED